MPPVIRVEVRPEMLRWARERAGKSTRDLARSSPDLDRWETGEIRPTLKQLERFASATHAPIGYLFLAEPPIETVPIPDFRTVAGARLSRPSPDLLDTVYVCQQRQEWYRGFARLSGEEFLPFVGSVRTSDDVEATAATMRHTLGFDVEERHVLPDWTTALRRFIEQADGRGVLVMCNGVVNNDTRRRLDPDEFRGFALSDPLAPLVFVNGADTKSAQMFTLAHELAHIWLGQSGVSDVEASSTPSQAVERWCNRVAAELLVPLALVRAEVRDARDLRQEIDRLARRFKVSTLVVLRRIHDAGRLTAEEFRVAYANEVARVRPLARDGGGNFYLTLGARVSKRFARAIVVSALEGETSFTEAFRLLGIRKMSTFDNLGSTLGVTNA